jgi:hypothetical protein
VIRLVIVEYNPEIVSQKTKKNPKSRYTFWMASSADLFPRNMFQSACIKLKICAGFEFMVGIYCSKDGTANVCMLF